MALIFAISATRPGSAAVCAIDLPGSALGTRKQVEKKISIRLMSLTPSKSCCSFDRGKNSLEELIAVALMPAPHDYEVVVRIYPNRVRSVAYRREARSRRRWPLLLLRIQPPEKAVVRSERARRRG